MTALRAFLVRDLRSAWSYRFSFLVQCVSLLFSLVSLKFVSELVSPGAAPSLSQYNGDYFAFALVGITLSILSIPIVKSFANAVRGAQVTGTFEAMLTTRAHPVLIVFNAGIFAIMIACAQAMLALVVGAVVFGAGLHLTHLGLSLLVLLMTVLSLAGIGLMSAGFVIAFKQSEPFSGALIAGSFLISGILYPTTVLPSWLAVLAPLSPITHAAALSRALLVDGADTSAMAVHFAALGVFCLLMPAGAAMLSFALRYAKRTGSLAHY